LKDLINKKNKKKNYIKFCMLVNILYFLYFYNLTHIFVELHF
jgi:hypothetical protein